MSDTVYFLKNYDEEVWRTISVVSIDGEPHAYQQKRIVGRPKYKNTDSFSRNSSGSFSGVMVDTDDHRLVPIEETISDENRKELADSFNVVGE